MMLACVLPAKAGGRELLGGQAAADLVPPLEDADAHAAVLDEVQRQEERLVAATDDDGVERLVRHDELLRQTAAGTMHVPAPQKSPGCVGSLNQARTLSRNDSTERFIIALRSMRRSLWLSPPRIFQRTGLVVCSSMIR